MRLFLLAALAMLAIPGPAAALHPGPTCAEPSVQTTFAGVTDSNCTQVSAYVCTDPRYFGGGGGKVPILSNWVCDQRTYLSDLLA